MTLDLGDTAAEIRDLTTTDRLAAYRQNKPDPDLEETLFQHARLPDDQQFPARRHAGHVAGRLEHLQQSAVKRNDYHTDVNVEMNYWFVDQANLSECFLPLGEWVPRFARCDAGATKKEFNVRGWSNPLRERHFRRRPTYHWVPGDASWVAQNLWDHYAFTQDKEYLRTRGLSRDEGPLRILGGFVEGATGWQAGQPKSQSPEHGPFSEGNSYEQQLAWDLFTNYIEASKTLGVDSEFGRKWS